MMRASFISPRGTWHAKAADSVVLDYEGRHRRRLVMKGVRGVEFLLDLPQAVHLHGGDALVLDDGRLVEVVAAPEKLAEIRASDPLHLARIVWHLGNRHLQVEFLPGRIRIRRDHVIEEMLQNLGAKLRHIEAPFEPESGAYDAAHGHGHDASHGHKHDHAHGH